MAAKVEIQIRFISKHHVNDYISTISKNYLSTFTGQLCIDKIKIALVISEGGYFYVCLCEVWTPTAR